MTTPIGIVPISGALPAPAALPPPKLTPHKGIRLLTAVEVYTIFWGTGWQQAPQNGLIQQLNNFFDFILTSLMMDLLSEYSVTGQTIGHGRRVGTNTITRSVGTISADPGTVQPGGGRLVTDGQIQQALQGWINSTPPTIPRPNNNTLFFVYLPPNVTVSTLPNGGISCGSNMGDFCGYHGATIIGAIPYAVMPYLPCPGGICSSGQNQPLDTLTEVSSHELCEAITDPDLNTGWYDDNLVKANQPGEIGDICNRRAIRFGDYNVQLEWSNRYNNCMIAPYPSGRSESRELTSYVTLDGRSQHVFYRSADGRVHEVFGPPWRPGGTDLMAAQAGLPSVSPGSVLSSYARPDDNSQHVFYVGTDGRVYELFWLPTPPFWRAGGDDLRTAQAGLPSARATALSSHILLDGPSQHVFYVGTDNRVHELLWHPTDPFWRPGGTDLMAVQAGLPSVSPGSVLSSYAWLDGRSQHVFYVGTDNRVYELFGPPWRAGGDDLRTAQAGLPSARATALTSHMLLDGPSQHVFYRGSNGHVYELLWLPTAPFWRDAGDLTCHPVLQVQPFPTPRQQNISTLTVFAHDEATGQPVDGHILIDDRKGEPNSVRDVGRTNTRIGVIRFDPFRDEIIPGHVAILWPTGTVTMAPGYCDTPIDFGFPADTR